jgi:hypothetical protein
LDAATPVIVGDIQTSGNGFNAPLLPVEFKPAEGGVFFRAGTGGQGDFFVLASGGLAEQTARRTCKRTAPFCFPDAAGLDGTTF